jgi:PLD-like domain
MSEPDAEPAGEDPTAPFTLKLHRGEGMVLLGMNWKGNSPPDDFVGFGIQFREPGGSDFLSVSNRLTFDGTERKPSMQAPIQKFRWVHFPFNAERRGDFTYRVTPVFMDEQDELSFGEAQEANVELARETFPDKLNISFTRGFVSSQAFVDRFLGDGQEISSLLPMSAEPLDFVPTHAQADVALPWMGFEARSALLEVLDEAVADASAEVHTIAYDLNQPEILDRLEQLGSRLTVIIDDAGPHGKSDSPETTAFERLKASAGPTQVRRQHLGGLQHNKCVIVSGPDTNKVVCGSTNFSWRGLYVQNNNAVVLTGPAPVAVFRAAFDDYWASNDAAAFGSSSAALWTDLGLADVDARAVFSPHTPSNAVLGWVAKDIDEAESSLFYSLAFLYMTKGSIRTAIEAATARDDLFVYGISDRTVEGLDL